VEEVALLFNRLSTIVNADSLKKSTQVPFHEQLTLKSKLFQSSLIKVNQDILTMILHSAFCILHSTILCHFSQVFVFRDPKQSAENSE
jgi:hypothetical protein